MAMLLQELRIQHPLNMDQCFLKYLKEILFQQQLTGKTLPADADLSGGAVPAAAALSGEHAAVAALLLTLLARQFIRLDHFVVKSCNPILTGHDLARAAPVLIVLRLMFQPELSAGLGVCSAVEIDAVTQHLEQLPLSVIYNLVFHAFGCVRGQSVTAPVAFDANSLPLKFVRAVLLNPGIQRVSVYFFFFSFCFFFFVSLM